MKVKDLITALQELDGNLEVYSMTDHGQSPEKSNYPTIVYAEEASYCLWDDWCDDEDDADDQGYTQKVVLL